MIIFDKESLGMVLEVGILAFLRFSGQCHGTFPYMEIHSFFDQFHVTFPIMEPLSFFYKCVPKVVVFCFPDFFP